MGVGLARLGSSRDGGVVGRPDLRCPPPTSVRAWTPGSSAGPGSGVRIQQEPEAAGQWAVTMEGGWGLVQSPGPGTAGSQGVGSGWAATSPGTASSSRWGAGVGAGSSGHRHKTPPTALSPGGARTREQPPGGARAVLPPGGVGLPLGSGEDGQGEAGPGGAQLRGPHPRPPACLPGGHCPFAAPPPQGFLPSRPLVPPGWAQTGGSLIREDAP